MRRLLFAICCLLSALSTSAPPTAEIAVIIDDLGNDLQLGRQAVNLPGAVTYAVLPRRAYSAELARRAHAAGKEIMLHLPMQASGGRHLGQGGLHLGLNRAEFARQVRVGLAAIPHVAGVNNHMGSLLTRHPGAMRWLMEDLGCFDRLYFVDSRTDVRTVARDSARAAGLSNAQRDVFLDNHQEPEYIRAQWRRLIARAKQRGSAIAIGHPYPATLKVLAEELPALAAQGIRLVPVSRLVERERNDKLWHASSSPLPTVAKNSRQ